MTRKFSELRKKMSPKSLKRSEDIYQKMKAEMPLHELRRARGLSQEELAKCLGIKQPNVAKMEKRTDMYISSLRNVIEEMGRKLNVVARFPEGDVTIENFSSIAESKTHLKKKNKSRSAGRSEI